MKKILLISLITFNIYAGDLASYNLLLESQKEIDNRTETTIITPQNEVISVISTSELTVDQEDLIGRSFNTFFNWDELKIESFQMIFEDDQLSILIKPYSLIYNETDIAQYLPSGIQLYYDSFFEYDFRMSKDLLFMRLKGQFYSKEEFLEELNNAVLDPILYIQIHDPSYLIRQIDELRSINKEQDNTINEMQKIIEELSLNHSKLVNAVLSLNNTSFLGSALEFNKSDIKEIIEVKSNNPDLTVDDVVSTLKIDGVKVTDDLVKSVFMIYFDEFPQNR